MGSVWGWSFVTGIVAAVAGGSGGLRVSLSPTTVIGFGTGTVTTTQSMVGTASGGISPYSWAWITFDPDIFSVQPTQNFSFFRRNDVMSGEIYGTTARLTVTDAIGQTAYAEGSVTITGV